MTAVGPIKVYRGYEKVDQRGNEIRGQLLDDITESSTRFEGC